MTNGPSIQQVPTEGQISMGDLATELSRPATETFFDQADMRTLVGSVGGPTTPGTEIQLSDYYGASVSPDVPLAPSNLVVTALHDRVAVLPGAAADHFSTPVDPMAGATSGSWVWYGTITDPGRTQTLTSKWGTNQNQFVVRFNPTLTIQFYISATGTSSESATSSALNVEPNQYFGMRVDWLGPSVDFYFDYGNGWELDGNVAIAALTLAASTTELSVGRQDSNTTLYMDGTTELAEIYRGSYTPGDLVLSFNVDDATGTGTGQQWNSSATLEQWTAQGAAEVQNVDTKVWDTFTAPNGTLISAHTPDIGGSWINLRGPESQIQGNKCELQVIDNNRVIIDAGATDVVVSGDFLMKFGGTGNTLAYVMVRNVDNDNWYRARMSASSGLFDLQRQVNAQPSEVLASVQGDVIIGPETGTVTVVSEGSTITATYVGPSQTLSISYAVANDFLTETKHGFTLQNTSQASAPFSSVDNFKVTALDNNAVARQARLTWQDNADNEDLYEVERQDDGGGFNQIVTNLPPNTELYDDVGPLADGTYDYRVKASNAAGDSPYSNEDTITIPEVTAGKVAVLPGGAGDWFESPNSPAVYLASQADVLVEVSLTDWKSGTAQTFVGVAGDTNSRSWFFSKGSADNLNIIISEDGTNGQQRTYNSDPVPFEANQKVWVRVRWNGLFGGSGSSAIFSYSLNGINYTTLTTVTDNVNRPVPFQSGTPLEVGGLFLGSIQNVAGAIYSVKIFDGYEGQGGVVVAEFNANDATDFGLTQTWPSSATGEQWTAQGQARISAVNTLVQDSFTAGDGTLLQDHTPEVGGPWERYDPVGFPETMEILSEAAQKSNTTTTFSGYLQLDNGDVNAVASVDFTWQGAGNSTTRNDLHLFVRKANTTNGEWFRLLVQSNASGMLMVLERRVTDGGATDEIARVTGLDVPANGEVVRFYVTVQNGVMTAWNSRGDSVSGAATGLETNIGTGMGTNFLNSPSALSSLDNFLVTSITEQPL